MIRMEYFSLKEGVGMMLYPEDVRVKLNGGLASKQMEANRAYLLKLDEDSLLINYRLEAGIIGINDASERRLYGGWELPTCQLRGHFLGYFMSAAARQWAVDGDERLRAKLIYIVRALGVCQDENGGEWCFSIPEKYIHRLFAGKRVWAPQCTAHKTLMGLLDAYEYARIDQALTIAKRAADWFLRFTDGVSRDHMNAVMESSETGGLMEAWADLYRLTGNPEHLKLMRRYERPLYYERLLSGEDVLTNKHANSTIPEILGVCKAYEVTGEARYLDIARAYYKCAVDDRGWFVTGGQTAGEVWTPKFKQAERLGNKNQEFCTVYNMMRLAEFLLRADGDIKYADYWEKNLYNGVFAQCYFEPFHRYAQSEDDRRKTALLSYFLPLEPGAKKRWGSEFDHFWCCHGTMVQANSDMLRAGIVYSRPGEIWLMQYLPMTAEIPGERAGLSAPVTIALAPDDAGETRPKASNFALKVNGGGQAFTLCLRKPDWARGRVSITHETGERAEYTENGRALTITRAWGDVALKLSIPRVILAHPLPDMPNCAAFTDGPVALAALTDAQPALTCELKRPERMFIADDEREWGVWNPNFRTVGQNPNLRFTPLYNIRDERYTTYFPINDARENTCGD